MLYTVQYKKLGCFFLLLVKKLNCNNLGSRELPDYHYETMYFKMSAFNHKYGKNPFCNELSLKGKVGKQIRRIIPHLGNCQGFSFNILQSVEVGGSLVNKKRLTMITDPTNDD